MSVLAITAMAERDLAKAAAGQGDGAAFDALMRRHERLVLGTALRLTGNLADAQDASQEVFLRLYRNLRKLEGRDLAPWLYRVTVNVCHDLRRRRPEPAGEMDAASEGGNPQERALADERRRALELSLKMLPEKQRAALVLRDLEGLTTEEVARALGTTEATVRSHISTARVKVKGFLERYFRRQP